MRRLFLALSTFTFAALVLAGCGGDAVATTTPAATAPAAATVAATRATTTAATGATATPAAASSATGGAATSAPIVPATTGAAATAATAAVTQAAAAAPAMGGTIRIGMIASLTGPYNPLGTANKQAADLVTKQVNDAGGINGAKIELMVEDDKSDPSQGPIALKKLLSNKIVALIGPVFSSTCLALYDDEDAAKIPTINQCATDANVTPSIRPYIFMTPPTATVQAKQVVAYLKAQGKTKVTVMHDSTDYGNTGWNALKTEAPKSGITVDEQLYELTGTTFVPQLTKIKNSDTQALVSWGSGGAAVIITKEFRQLGLTIPLVFSAAQSTPLYTKPAGDAANGVVLASGLGPVGKSLPADNPSKPIIAKFDTDFMAAYNSAPPEFAYNTFSAMNMLYNTIRKVGTDSQKIRDDLEKTTYVGADGTYRYSSTDHAGLGLDSVLVATVKDGQFVLTPFSGGK